MALITISEYARRNGLAPATARRKAQRCIFKTARKIGGDWVIDEAEPLEKGEGRDNREARSEENVQSRG